MIIKKKYTTIKKTAEESPIIEEPIIEDVSVQVTRDVVKKEDGVVQPTVQTQEETSKEKKKRYSIYFFNS